MFYQCFIFIFYSISCLLPMCYSGSEPTLTMGAFKTSIVSVRDCINPDRPFVRNPPMILLQSVQNVNGKNLLTGNLTVLRDTKDVKTKFKSFVWRNGKRQQSHSFNNLNCHGALLHFTFSATKVKYDKKNCMFLKGFYSFKDMDVNQLQHIWVPTMPYGRLVWRSESFNSCGMLICKEFETITEPANKD